MGPRLKRGKELKAEDGEESSEGGNFVIVVLGDERERIESDMTDTETEVRGGVNGGSVHALGGDGGEACSALFSSLLSSSLA